MDEQIVKLLQAQLTLERTNAAVYDAMSAALANVFWPGSAGWMKHAADEERTHADKIVTYLVQRKVKPNYNWIQQANSPDGEDLAAYFEAALTLEKKTTAAILALYALAVSMPDAQTEIFLHWFIAEQTQSEGELMDFLALLKRLDNNGRVVFDKELLG